MHEVHRIRKHFREVRGYFVIACYGTDKDILHGETGSSTVCANGTQKSLMVSSVRIGHLLFTQNKKVTERDKDEFDLIM